MDATQSLSGQNATIILEMNYYDAVLLMIPALFTFGGGLGFVTSLSIQTGLIVGSALCVLLVGHGMFINPPIDPEKLPGIDSKTPDQSSFGADNIVSDD